MFDCALYKHTISEFFLQREYTHRKYLGVNNEEVKGEIDPVLNWLSITPRRRMRELMYRSTFY
jgi:hypothetical protein